MANIKVSEMPTATSFENDDYTMIVQSNKNKKITKQNMLGNIENNIGNLSNLTTTDKTSLVGAINENNTKIGNITGQILWTNSNPTQEFVEQNITLSSSDYDMILVLFKRARDQDELVSGTTIKGYGIRVVTVAGDGKTRRRVLNYVNSTTYTVTNAFGEDGTQINGTLVPLYIIGYKTGLF